MTIYRHLILVTCFSSIAGAAHAGLQICNDSDETQGVSIGYKDGDNWTSEGWWNVKPGECLTPVGGDLKQRYYYLRAEVSGGPFDGGGFYFCTTPEAYTIVGDAECSERGYDHEDFIEIDTGQTAKDFTYRLSQAAMDTAQSGEGLGLKFCNETGHTQSISIGYKDGDGFTSEGWWNVDPGECKKPIGGALKNQFYYYRAEVDAGDFNGGGYKFCTTSEAYTIEGDENCAARGYDEEDFAEIDTGETAKGYTFTLTAANSGLVEGGGDAPSKPGFTVCNDTEETQSVSIGYQGDEDWTSEGWWNVDPGDCSTLIDEPLKKQYYYYRAEVNGGDFDGENYTFCTTPEAYTIVGDTNCEARGYDKETFREVNVGEGVTSYTLTLIPPPGNGGPVTDRSTNETTDDMGSVGAGLEVCNETEHTQSLSFGYNGDDGWTSEGWWNAEPGECVTPVLDGTPRRYFYYRAEVNAGDFDGQGYFFCTDPQEYTIVGDENCEARGYDREDFYEIDTGGTEGMFTFTLVSDSDAPMADPTPDADTGKPSSSDKPGPDQTTKGGGLDFDRSGDETPVTPVEEPPLVDPDPDPVPESDGGKRGTGRRGGSRGG